MYLSRVVLALIETAYMQEMIWKAMRAQSPWLHLLRFVP